MRQGDYQNFEAVLRRARPSRPTLFELFHADCFYEAVAGPAPDRADTDAHAAWKVRGWERLGYDFVNEYCSALRFPSGPRKAAAGGVSMNEGYSITDWESFEAYPWPDPDTCDDRYFQAVLRHLPDGMKANIFSYGGVLENVTQLLGFDNMCVFFFEQPDLVRAVFDKVGRTLVRYYRRAANHPKVGALIASDDWGHKTQTTLSPEMLRTYVFPWYRQLTETAHDLGKYAILHSCGCLRQIMDDIIDDMRFDAKHSFEDVIQPVEEAYEAYGARIAILGGIDVDFICQRGIPEIQARARAILAQTKARGGYALGTGNSATPYTPVENYLAMLRVATEEGA